LECSKQYKDGKIMVSSKGVIELIKTSEGFSAKPYLCPAGVATIGYGSTLYPDGTHVAMTDPVIDLDTGEAMLLETLKSYESAVAKAVTVPLNQNQFDALVDFAYNAGAGNLRSSTLLKKLNAGDYAGAADEFGKWVKGGGKTLPGLVKRREAERKLFTTAV
jgi:lysozyme